VVLTAAKAVDGNLMGPIAAVYLDWPFDGCRRIDGSLADDGPMVARKRAIS